MICPIHNEEFVDNTFTAICIKCCKRYNLCNKQYYMEHCNKIKNHELDGDELHESHFKSIWK